MVSDIRKEDRDLADRHFDNGLSKDIKGRLDEAISEMEKAIGVDPGFAEAYNKLGDFYMKKGWITKAAGMFEKSIELKPETENSYFDLGCALALLGRYSEALNHLERALSIDPNHYEIYGRMGKVYFEMNLYAEAIENLKKALVKDQNDIMARFTLGMAYQKIQKKTDAQQQFETLIEQYSHLAQLKDRFAEAHYYIGRAYFFMENYAKAIEHLKMAVEFDTERVDHHFSFGMYYRDADAFFAMGEALAASGDKIAARVYLQKALDLDSENQKFLDFQKEIY